MINRKEAIKSKGFGMGPVIPEGRPFEPVDFSKIKLGVKTLNDAVYSLGEYKRLNPTLADKEKVLRAIQQNDLKAMREISNFFYKTSGIYSRLCRYMAYLYRYDWLVTPFTEGNPSKDKVLLTFNKCLRFLDKTELKRLFGDIALKVMRNGCYYGYLVKLSDRATVQELPLDYCRSRFKAGGQKPAVEFNMKFFDEHFSNAVERMKILDVFPPEFKKGYILYKQGKLKPEFNGDDSGWYLLSVENAFKFNMNGDDNPFFISVIPSIIDLDEAIDLDKKKQAQQLLKIIIQKMPLDKNGDLVFDVDEARELHNNAVAMLSKAIGLDVLTTFADVDVADMSDRSSNNATDTLERFERTVYNEAGTPQNLFNSSGNITVDRSILNDESTMSNLIFQFESFINEIINHFNKNKKITLEAQILPTTIYNYKEMAKIYKEQTQLGYSKMLPQIALGQSQSSILANAFFENDILDLVNVFIPPLMSSTMNAEVLNRHNNKKTTGEGSGRKELEDSQKSDKTIANRESMS